MTRKKGFSLLEAMIAMVLIAVVVLANFEFFRYSYRMINYAKLRLTAVNLARESMEELYWQADPPDTTDEEDPILLSGEINPGDLYCELRDSHGGTRKYSVDGSNGRYKITTVTVEWGP